MKLSRFSKQIIAVACSIAMVVAGLVFVPSADTKADAPDWSTIDYLGDGAGGGTYTNKYKFYAENGTKAVNIQHPGFSEEDGIYIGFPAADIQMDLAGYAVQGAGACIYLSNFTQKVTEFTVSWAGGSTTCYVYYEDGTEGPTTTPDPSAPTQEPTTKNPWKSIPNGGSQWYYNDVTKQNISAVVNIQHPGWADEDGVYINVPAGVSQVDVNGVTEGVAAIQGAGFVVYLSAMTKKYNDVTITYGGGTAYIQIENTNGSEEPTTEAPTGETETPTEETSTAEPTTEADHWVNVAGSNDLQYWSATDTKVISYQDPGWSGQKEAGVYVLNPDGMGAPVKVVIDGVETNVAQGDNDTFYCMGAGLLFYGSTLAKPIVNVEIYYAPATTTKHDLIFKNINSPMVDVTEYKAHGTYPEKEGKIFAGFFEDAGFTTAYTETTGYAYAKFIDEKVLGTKFQTATDGTAVRFLSSLDSMDYQSVGFKFTGTYGQTTITEKTKSVEKLYTSIKADGQTILPSVFSDDSAYFFTYTVRGMDPDTSSTWNVTPFYVTLDGTTVEGTSGVYSHN